MTINKASSHKTNLIDYCERFSALNVSKQKGTAYYKPILLLSVIDLISQGIITENKIFVSEDLINAFNNYWKLLKSEYKGGLHYPFFHLISEGFWHLEFKPTFNGLQPKTVNKLKQAVEYATLDEELFLFIQDPNSRTQLIDTLLLVWFSSSQKEMREILEINNNFQTQEAIELDSESSQTIKYYTRKSLVRNAFFRKSIIYLYDYQCALCQLKVIQSLTQTIVDGAHIKPFSKFYDNKIDNGISLCKNYHWAFDQGLFTMDDDYKILVSDNFEEISPNARSLKAFSGEKILLPHSIEYFPRLEAIQWHRENIFLG
jgi:putative restriction endonuclease